VEIEKADIFTKCGVGQNLFSVLCQADREERSNATNELFLSTKRKMALYLLEAGLNPDNIKDDKGTIIAFSEFFWKPLLLPYFLKLYHEIAKWFAPSSTPNKSGTGWKTFRYSPFGTLIPEYLCPKQVTIHFKEVEKIIFRKYVSKKYNLHT
jgi:hypothetical protein